MYKLIKIRTLIYHTLGDPLFHWVTTRPGTSPSEGRWHWLVARCAWADGPSRPHASTGTRTAHHEAHRVTTRVRERVLPGEETLTLKDCGNLL